ncbi:hypothetical protein [Parabacteroides sp. AM08-6]|uniref:hypothetical protein n=1 Tax=Parabacteroides sp. AM08-6 TaxID=2292053 RepID=UPI000EFDF7C7|nr:hypothetical protein [Parabacteroides sp. AM08-6]RHJ86559.1 hypothetical protein DW103_02520 [Parabacteroides sp. AM08-6]
MAVTKIRKISSWTLLISAIISIVVLGIFYAGGVVDPAVENKEPIYTGLLLNWMYVLFGVTIACAVIFAIWQFVSLLKTNPKSAITSLIVLVLFAIMLFITYSIGDTTPLAKINADSAQFNVPFWLKVTDMWIYSTCILLVLIVLAVVAGSVKKLLNK